MNKLFQYAGIAASIVLIALGIGADRDTGIDGRSDGPRRTSPASRSSARPDMAASVRRPAGRGRCAEAKAFAAGMRKHTLEATGWPDVLADGRATLDRGRQGHGRREGRPLIDPASPSQPVENPARAACGSPRPP